MQPRTFGEKKYEFGIAPGVLFYGDVYFSLHGDNVKQNSNFLIRTYAEAFVIPQISFGIYFNYSTLNLEEDIEVFSKTITSRYSNLGNWRIDKTTVYIIRKICT